MNHTAPLTPCRSAAYVRSIASRQQQQLQQQQAAEAQPVGFPPPAVGAEPLPQQLLQTALVDPSDPTCIYLTQPLLDDSQRRQDTPLFPALLV